MSVLVQLDRSINGEHNVSLLFSSTGRPVIGQSANVNNDGIVHVYRGQQVTVFGGKTVGELAAIFVEGVVAVPKVERVVTEIYLNNWIIALKKLYT